MERKTMKIPENIHRELKTRASSKGMSMIEYLEYLLKKEKEDER